MGDQHPSKQVSETLSDAIPLPIIKGNICEPVPPLFPFFGEPLRVKLVRVFEVVSSEVVTPDRDGDKGSLLDNEVFQFEGLNDHSVGNTGHGTEHPENFFHCKIELGVLVVGLHSYL